MRKWRSSDEAVLEQVPPELRDDHDEQEITEDDRFTKLLGIEWNSHFGCFPSEDR